MKEDSVTKQSQIIVRIMEGNSFRWDMSFLFDVCESTHLFTLCDSYMRKWETPPPAMGEERKKYLHRDITQRYYHEVDSTW